VISDYAVLFTYREAKMRSGDETKVLQALCPWVTAFIVAEAL